VVGARNNGEQVFNNTKTGCGWPRENERTNPNPKAKRAPQNRTEQVGTQKGKSKYRRSYHPLACQKSAIQPGKRLWGWGVLPFLLQRERRIRGSTNEQGVKASAVKAPSQNEDERSGQKGEGQGDKNSI